MYNDMNSQLVNVKFLIVYDHMNLNCTLESKQQCFYSFVLWKFNYISTFLLVYNIEHFNNILHLKTTKKEHKKYISPHMI